jgi:hypothetical protein
VYIFVWVNDIPKATILSLGCGICDYMTILRALIRIRQFYHVLSMSILTNVHPLHLSSMTTVSGTVASPTDGNADMSSTAASLTGQSSPIVVSPSNDINENNHQIQHPLIDASVTTPISVVLTSPTDGKLVPYRPSKIDVITGTPVPKLDSSKESFDAMKIWGAKRLEQIICRYFGEALEHVSPVTLSVTVARLVSTFIAYCLKLALALSLVFLPTLLLSLYRSAGLSLSLYRPVYVTL